MQDNILRVTDIQKNYGHIRALQGASLSVKKGSITAVVGDNGSGKSTLIKILSGNIKPDGGIIQVEDNSYGRLTVKKAMELGIRTVYQDLSLDNYKNSIENIFLGAELTKGPFLNRGAMKEEAAAILDSIRVNVPDLEEPVVNLSGGQRQGIAITLLLIPLFYHTKWGNYVMSLGGNPEALKRCGVPIGLYRISVFVLTGFLSAVAGIIVTARFNSAEADAGLSMEMDAICAVVMGGTAMRGGSGSLMGTVAAVFLMGLIRNGLTIMSVSSYYQQFITGAMMLCAVVIAEMRERQTRIG